MYPSSLLSAPGSLSTPVPTSQGGAISPAVTALDLALTDLQEISGVAAPLAAPDSDAQWLDPKSTGPLKHFTGQLYDAVQQTPALREPVISKLTYFANVLEDLAQSVSDMDKDEVAKQIDIVKLHVEGTLWHLQNDVA